MRISTLSIGDELIAGRVVDTNAAFIAATLHENGLGVLRHHAVGDSEPDIIGALSDLGRVSDAVIVTGGLGPTADDLTARAAARATGRRLVINEEARAHVREISGRLEHLLFCPLNDKQAMLPAKSTLIPNPSGTACGFHLIHNGSFMFFMPGVPSEMRVMLRQSVIPFLLERVPRRRVFRTAHFDLFGPCEAEVDEMLLGIARPEAGLVLGICVGYPAMRVTLRAEADTAEAAGELLSTAAGRVRERLGEYIYAEGEADVARSVAELFFRHGLTLSLAESCTGGMIGAMVTGVPGSSRFFLDGVVCYSNGAKQRLAGVPEEVITRSGAVSSECAAALAKGVRAAAGSDLGLAVTGIAGPEGGSDDKPVGTVFISLAAPDGCWTKRFHFRGSRDEVRTMTAWTALDWLRRYLLRRQV